MMFHPVHVVLLTCTILGAATDAETLTLFPLGLLDSSPASMLENTETSGEQVTPTGTQAVAGFNCCMLMGMSWLLFKVLKAPSAHLSDEDAREDQSIGKALPAVILWCSLGVILICFNKYMYMTREKGGFGFACPMALTWWHMVTGLIATNIIRVAKPALMPAVLENKMDLRTFVTSVLPIGLIFAAYLAIGNTAYLYLSVSFVQMLKSAGPLFVFGTSVACGMEKISTASVVAISIIVMGVAGASVGEVSFSWFGFGLQFSAFFLDGCRMVLLKYLISSRGSKLDPLSGIYYYSPVCVVCLAWPVWHFEGQKLLVVLNTAPSSLIAVIVVNGLVAFALNVSLLALFASASATTVSVASVVRDMCLTFGSALLFHSTITKVQVLGYLSACFGVKLWDEVKTRPDAFYKAFGIERHQQLPLNRAD